MYKTATQGTATTAAPATERMCHVKDRKALTGGGPGFQDTELGRPVFDPTDEKFDP